MLVLYEVVFFVVCIYRDTFMVSFKVLGARSWIVDVLLICRMSFPGCVSTLVSVKKITLNKFDFVEDVNSWGRHEF